VLIFLNLFFGLRAWQSNVIDKLSIYEFVYNYITSISMWMMTFCTICQTMPCRPLTNVLLNVVLHANVKGLLNSSFQMYVWKEPVNILLILNWNDIAFEICKNYLTIIINSIVSLVWILNDFLLLWVYSLSIYFSHFLFQIFCSNCSINAQVKNLVGFIRLNIKEDWMEWLAKA